jgi:phosphomannomutase/phosphoglucomutase
VLRDRVSKSGLKVVDIDGLKIYDKGGWVLIRASNTVPVIKLNAEAKTEGDMNMLFEWGKALVEGEIQKVS